MANKKMGNSKAHTQAKATNKMGKGMQGVMPMPGGKGMKTSAGGGMSCNVLKTANGGKALM